MANLTAPMIPICLERGDGSMPWGFRLQGGADYRLCLSVKKVIIIYLNHCYFKLESMEKFLGNFIL